MALEKTYQPGAIEEKWYAYWMSNQHFKSTPDQREPYTVVIPPPNVTGVLHMGHMLNNTIQDVLIRRARMLGKNACWVPGTDHASIATEAKVVGMLREQGIKKSDLSREDFLKHAWTWKEKYGGIILEQLKKLGASCDWDRTSFTMDPALSEAVIDVFVDLYKKGYIYRGLRMVNWDPAGKTAVSDEEVIHKEVQSRLYYIKYQIEGTENEYVTIATTRPETILADTAVCVHPEDERYAHLKGKRVIVPICKRSVPIIFDDYIDREFGTGALKVTPAHDANDYALGLKHNLEVIDSLNEDGTLSAAAGFYIGEDRFVVRKKIAKDLEALGLLEKTEDLKNSVGYSERTDAVIEPRLSMQWYVRMPELCKPALDAVINGEVSLIPGKFINTYRHWMENVKDWCISRQLWWGHRIPAWYDDKGKFVVAKTLEEAQQLFSSEHGYNPAQLTQDEDVLDTWFSSWLWPISVFDPSIFGKADKTGNADLQYYYPTNDLVTAPEILFFWVARMIIAGYEYKGQKPFKNVYLTGIVRDKLGRKMSKSLGNSPDPLDLIAQYGADGVRMGMLLSSPAGNDILFDESQVEQGRNFCNKIWNAYRLLSGWEIKPDTEFQAAQLKNDSIAADWFRGKLNNVLREIEQDFENYRLSDALMSIYKLIWDDFCSWYLEMIKPAYGQPLAQSTYEQCRSFFSELMRLLHPYMPFITEELYHELHNGQPAKPVIISPYPKAENAAIIGQEALDLITEIRNLRNSKGISPKVELEVAISQEASGANTYQSFEGLICKLANVPSLRFANSKPEGWLQLLVGKDEVYVNAGGNIDVAEEKSKIQKEIDYLQGFLQATNAKLSNEKFVANAKPELVEKERQKQADAETKIRLLQENLKSLG